MTISYSYGTWSFTWPYPRMFTTDFYVLALAPSDWLNIIGETPAGSDDDLVMYELICSSNAWVAHPVHNLGLVTNVDQVKVAGFGPFYIVCSFDESEESVISLARKGAVTEAYDPSYLYSHRFESLGTPPAIAACNFKGQVILVGLAPGIEPWNSLGWCSAAWASPGTFEFNPQTNKGAGFAKLPLDDYGKGFVYDVRRLNDRLVAYGNLGVCGLKPFSNERVSGFGIEELPFPGLSSGNHVAGDHRVHAYISDEYELWIVQGDGEFKKLGYKEFLEPLVTDVDDTPTIVSYVPQRERFYISNGDKCYVLTKNGMYECHQMVSGAGVYRGQLCGFFGDSADYEWRVKINPNDFGLRALKTIATVEVGGEYVKTSQVMSGRVTYKYGYNTATFTNGDWIRLDNRGVFHPRITAHEMCIAVKGGDYRDAVLNLDYIRAQYQWVDRHSIRSNYDSSGGRMNRVT